MNSHLSARQLQDFSLSWSACLQTTKVVCKAVVAPGALLSFRSRILHKQRLCNQQPEGAPAASRCSAQLSAKSR